jgi:dimethylargininase
MLIAITRGVSPSIQHCELTHLGRVPIHWETACLQHRHYEATLGSLGVEVHALPVEADLPDAVFVEDTAVVLDECAVITRPGAASRRRETAAVARALAPYRKLLEVQPPGTLDGGDVLYLDGRLYVGLSTRSNHAAVEQIRAFLAPYQIPVTVVETRGCLHLKSAVTPVSPDTLLINPAWVDRASFAGLRVLEVDPSEPHAANALLVGETVVYQPSYPRTLKRLEQAGLRVVPADMSELGKAEGALTCCSLIFTDARPCR